MNGLGHPKPGMLSAVSQNVQVSIKLAVSGKKQETLLVRGTPGHGSKSCTGVGGRAQTTQPSHQPVLTLPTGSRDSIQGWRWLAGMGPHPFPVQAFQASALTMSAVVAMSDPSVDKGHSQSHSHYGTRAGVGGHPCSLHQGDPAACPELG